MPKTKQRRFGRPLTGPALKKCVTFKMHPHEWRCLKALARKHGLKTNPVIEEAIRRELERIQREHSPGELYPCTGPAGG